jgi:hypothetical protein
MPSAEHPDPRRALFWIVAGFCAVTAYFTGVFPPFGNSNELSRLQAVVAMAEHSTFAIDLPLRTLGDHEDKAESGGHFFSNKAPGLAFAALPVYRALRLLLPAPANRAGGAIFYAMRLLTVSLLCAIAAARLSARLLQRKAEERRAAPIIALAVLFGTPFLFYARSFFGHAWTAALLFLSWDLLRRCEEEGKGRRPAFFGAMAGLLSGWAVLSEYTVVPIALFLLLRAGWGRAWRSLLFFGAGAAVPAVLLLIYNAACFGSPWTLSSARETYPEYVALARQSLFGIGLPRPRVAWDYLFHPARGVLLFSPFLLWFFPGLVRWWRSREERADCVFVLAATVSFFLLLSGYANWHGGWSLGSRYLLPALFFAALPIARALVTPLSRGLFVVAALFSLANHLVLTSTWPHFPLDLPWPAAAGSAWFLARGWVAQNLGSLAGLPPMVSLAFPVFVLAALAVLAIRVLPPLVPRAAVAVFAGVTPLLALLLAAPEPLYTARLWRAAMLGAYSGRDPSREELLRVAAEASTPEQKRRAAWAWRTYGPRP